MLRALPARCPSFLLQAFPPRRQVRAHADADRQLDLLAVAQEVELRRGARRQSGDGVQHLSGIEYRCLVDAHQHVTRMHAGLLGWAVAHHAGDDGTFLLRRQLQRLGQLGRQVLGLHADVAPDHPSLADDLVHDLLHDGDGDGKADAQ